MSSSGDWHCVEALRLLISTGRSSEFNAARRRVVYKRDAEIHSSDPMVRARALRLAGREEEARSLWTRELSARTPAPEAWAGLWELDLSSRARRGAGLTRLSKAIACAPGDARWRAYRALGLLLARPKGEYSLSARGMLRNARSKSARAAAREALTEARSAIRLDPGFTLSFIVAALACEDLGRLTEARSWLGRAHELSPKEGWILLARSAAHLGAGDLAGFSADATAAHYLDEGAGALRFDGKDLSRNSARCAISAATRLLSLRPRAAWALALRADLKRFPEINDFAGALADFKAAVRISPREAWIRAYFSRALISAGDPAGALSEVSSAARLRPDCGWIRAWKGEVLRRLGRFRESEKELNTALRLDSDYEFAYAWRGGTRRALGRLDAALSDLSVAAALDPSYAWTFVERALVHRALGRLDEAFDDLDRARLLDPKSAWCARREDAPAAIAELDRRLKRRPRDARAFAWRGTTRLGAGDAAGAESDLARAVSLAPKYAWARAVHGEALSALGRPGAAVREFDAALALEPRLAEAVARRARARLDAGDARGALTDFSVAAEREPRAAWIHAGRGEAALRLRRWGEAREAFRQAAGLDQGDVRSLLGEARALLGAGRRRAGANALGVVVERARALAVCGRHEESGALATDVLAIDSRRLDALGVRGAARRAASDFAGALADAESVLSRRPRAAAAWLLKAEALRSLGRESEALDAAAQACAIEPGRSWAWTVRAKAARQAGRLPEALVFARRACRLDPRDAKAWAWQGDVLRALGHGARARRVLSRAITLEPSVAWPRAVLAEVLREAGDVRGAVNLWAETFRLDPRNSSAYDILGAEPPSVSGDPGRAWAYAWRAAARRAAGNGPAADSDLSQARALAPGLFAAEGPAW